MNQKIKFWVSIFTGIFFLASYVTGKLIGEVSGMRRMHSNVSSVTMLLVIAHIVGYFPMVKAQFKGIFKKQS